MAIWSKKSDHIAGAIHGEELKALIKERQQAGGPEIPWQPETSGYREGIIERNDDSGGSIYVKMQGHYDPAFGLISNIVPR